VSASRSTYSPRSATIKDSTGQRCPVEGRSALTDPAPGPPRMWRGADAIGRLRLLADRGSVGGAGPYGKPMRTGSVGGGRRWFGAPASAVARAGGGRSVGRWSVGRSSCGPGHERRASGASRSRSIMQSASLDTPARDRDASRMPHMRNASRSSPDATTDAVCRSAHPSAPITCLTRHSVRPRRALPCHARGACVERHGLPASARLTRHACSAGVRRPASGVRVERERERERRADPTALSPDARRSSGPPLRAATATGPRHHPAPATAHLQ
jgi:hypothetical protein